MRASPTLATWAMTFKLSMKDLPAAGASAVLMPKITMPPPLPLRYLTFLAYCGSLLRPG